jgi:UDP-N-acetylglucosamine 3-dehydrogenase
MVLNVGVIGVGNMGKNHARIYSELGDSRLVAVADISDRGKEMAERFNCRCYRDYREMMEKEKLDAVSVCVPTSMHFSVAKDVIGRGVNVLIEKPISGTLEEAEQLIAMAGRAGVKLAVGHVERFNPAVQKLKEMIDQGKLGNITSMLARRVGLFPPQIKDANVIIDLAVHDIDIFSYLLGRSPEKASASLGRALSGDREDYADIFMNYGETNGLIEVNWITPVKIRVLNVTGTKGYAELNYVTQELVIHESIYERAYDEFGDFVIKFGDPNRSVVPVSKTEPLKMELKDFLSSIIDDREPAVSGQSALETLRIALSLKD